MIDTLIICQTLLLGDRPKRTIAVPYLLKEIVTDFRYGLLRHIEMTFEIKILDKTETQAYIVGSNHFCADLSTALYV